LTTPTLGGPAESTTVSRSVIRVDRPMAEAAVAAGALIAVVAAVASRHRPTRALLGEAAAAAGVAVTVTDEPRLAAWALFEAGRQRDYLRSVTDHVVHTGISLRRTPSSAPAPPAIPASPRKARATTGP
jgi:hypothetical protein